MDKLSGKLLIVVLIAAFLGGCATTGTQEAAVPPKENPPLLVGVTTFYPPIIYRQGGGIKGLEADLAVQLARALDRPVRFVEMDWDDLIPALVAGRIDIIMSGMTVTEARKVRIRFTEPYLKIGLMTLMRTEDSSRYDSLDRIKGSDDTVGVVAGTAAEVYVRNHFSKSAIIRLLPSARDSVFALENRRIDLFVNDSPSVVWLASQNEGTLAVFLTPFNVDYLAWGVRPDDRDLLVQANAVLNSWKKDGTLKESITKWLPYWKDFIE